MLYERLSAGNSIIVRNQSDRAAPCECFPCCSGRFAPTHQRARFPCRNWDGDRDL